MPRKRTEKTKPEQAKTAKGVGAMPPIPAAEALSFLRETRGVSTWTAGDMAKSLKISASAAKQVISVLEMQGYVKRAEDEEWMTTLAGEGVAGSKAPRYTRERIEEALTSLRSRIAEINRESSAPYKITEAVAFGDFASGRPRVQAAEVGIQLERRKAGIADVDLASEHSAQQEFLNRLQIKGGVVHLRKFEKWMRERTHRDLRAVTSDE